MAYEDELRIVLVDEVDAGPGRTPAPPPPATGSLPSLPQFQSAGGKPTSGDDDKSGGKPTSGDDDKSRKRLEREQEQEHTKLVQRIQSLASGQSGPGAKGETAVRTLAGMEGGAGAASAAPMLAKLGATAGIAIAALVGLGVAAKSLIDSFMERAQQLAAYSPDVAQASALADVRSQLLDIQEAQELGPAMAEMIQAQSEMEATFRELMLPIKKFVVEFLAGAMTRLAEVLKNVEGYAAGTKEAIAVMTEAIVAAVQFNFQEANNILNGMGERVGQAVASAMREEQSPPSLMDQFFSVGGTFDVPQSVDQLREAANMGLNIPAFSLPAGP